MSRNGIDHRHCKWPLGAAVWVLTPDGYLKGAVNRHETEYPNRCDVAFEVPVDMGDANGRRFCHPIPFRMMRRDDPTSKRPTEPWYKKFKRGAA